MNLSDRHLTMLRASGISDDIIAQRGYETVTTKARLKSLGFGAGQCNVPALLIPIIGPTGEAVLYQSRPDQPRVRKGKVVKYETPIGSGMALDFTPATRHLLGNPSVPLVVTEGVKKGDALATIGVCSLAVLGVYNWRGRNEHGGVTALADWESIALKGREVFICFDSDVMLKREVHNALARLAAFLTSKGAHVLYIYLPAGEHHEKQGVDDLIGRGATADDIFAFASTELRPLPNDDRDEDGPYAEMPYGIVWRRPTKDGPVETTLTNFTARIVSDVIEDDGAEERRAFGLSADFHGRASAFSLPAAQFGGMSWVMERLGAGAACFPGVGTKDHARFAIQSFSGDVPTRHIFAHTGWRQIDGGWAFLHGNGAIGPSGSIADVETQLSGALGRYALPSPPAGTDLVSAVTASLRLIELGPLPITVTVLAATYLAPLSAVLDVDRPDFVVWLHGPSGVFKSEIGTLAQAHYGTFTRQTLPASFTDTANAVERILFAAKDALVVVDDYHPAHDKREEQMMATNASRLLRGVGNGSGRQRMRADTTLRPDLPPRALAIATGERLPSGHSTAARMFPVAIAKGDIDAAALSRAQDELPLYPAAMSAYLAWIAQRFETLRPALGARFLELRTAARSDGHPRDAAQVAHLQLGLETALQFAVDVRALDQERRDALLRASWPALLELGKDHQAEMAAEQPVEMFLRLLANGLASRTCFLESMTGDTPRPPTSWGWVVHRFTDASGQEQIEYRRPAVQRLLGNVDADWVYLLPDAAFQFAVQDSRAADRHFPVDDTTLWRRLAEAGVIHTQGSRRIVNKRFGGSMRRVVMLKRSALSLLSEEREQREQWEQWDAPDSNVPAPCYRSEQPSAFDGNAEREHADSRTADVAVVTAVPVVPVVEDVGDDRVETYI